MAELGLEGTLDPEDGRFGEIFDSLWSTECSLFTFSGSHLSTLGVRLLLAELRFVEGFGEFVLERDLDPEFIEYGLVRDEGLPNAIDRWLIDPSMLEFAKVSAR